ncbi:MAG: RloB family protein [Coleofasciculus sp. G1-WW12-02]|uniref:RloB family protein n=1 Tax=Coleofasciculus sp. G1-WW12-02 TaxID=3068483 RepID=UPI0033033A3A
MELFHLSVDSIFKPCQSSEESLNKNSSAKYDEVFCLFDGDRPEYKQAIMDAHRYSVYKIKPILSIPCFEFWFLLHYRYTSSPFENYKQVIAQLNKEFNKVGIEDYDKSKSGYYGLLKPQLDQAIANAKKLEGAACTNPLTQVHDIVIYLQAQKILAVNFFSNSQ